MRDKWKYLKANLVASVWGFYLFIYLFIYLFLSIYLLTWRKKKNIIVYEHAFYSKDKILLKANAFLV